MSDFEVQVEITDGVGVLRWDEQVVDTATLARAVSLAADDAIIAHDLRRLQVDLLEHDRPARIAVQRCGFRREGRLRAVHQLPDGSYADVLVYARLAVDPVYGALGFSGVMNSVLPTKRMIGHAIFRDGQGRILLTETTYKADWELPGGVIEPDESPRLGTAREVAEEIGMTVTFGQPTLVDWMPPYLGWGDAVEFIYDGGSLPDPLILDLRPIDTQEIRALHWVAAEDLDEHVTELSARRIRLILEGFTGATENGWPV